MHTRKDTTNNIILNVWTTGDSPDEDEVLAISIIDEMGTILFDKVIKPINCDVDQSVRSIKPSDVEAAKTIFDYEKELTQIFEECDYLIGYNMDFVFEVFENMEADISYLSKRTFDVMEEFASVHGQYSEWKGEYAYISIDDCAKYYGILKIEKTPLEGCAMILSCFQALSKDPAYLSKVNKIAIKTGQKPVRKPLKPVTKIALFSILFFLFLISGITSFGNQSPIVVIVIFIIALVFLYFAYKEWNQNCRR